jgi:hypothetical protein
LVLVALGSGCSWFWLLLVLAVLGFGCSWFWLLLVLVALGFGWRSGLPLRLLAFSIVGFSR